MKLFFLTLTLALIPEIVCAGTSLTDSCQHANGTILNNNLIQNYNIIIQPSLIEKKPSLLSIMYSGKWYESHDENTPTFLTMVQFSVTMNRKIDICVTSTDDSKRDAMQLVGIEFSDVF